MRSVIRTPIFPNVAQHYKKTGIMLAETASADGYLNHRRRLSDQQRNTRQRGKKLLSILLSAVMVTQMYAMPVQSAFAADGADEQQASTVEAQAGDESTPDDDSQNADDQAVVEPAPSTDDQQGGAAPAEEQRSTAPSLTSVRTRPTKLRLRSTTPTPPRPRPPRLRSRRP